MRPKYAAIDTTELARSTKALFAAMRSSRRRFSEGRKDMVLATWFAASFPESKKFPLLSLVEKRLGLRLGAFETRCKIGTDQYINDLDVEEAILGNTEGQNRLLVLVTRGNVSEENVLRLRQSFAIFQSPMMILGDRDLWKLEGWTKSGNRAACLIYLYMLVDEAKRKEGYTLKERYKLYMAMVLDQAGGLSGTQPRTLIKKIEFLLAYYNYRNCTQACREAGVVRKTFYNWCAKDPVFNKLTHSERSRNYT